MSTGQPEVADPAGPEGEPGAQPDEEPAAPDKRPLYPRLLRLRHVQPNGWQRAALGEGALGLAAVLVLADVASAWTLLVLPLGVAAVVKAHDVLAGALARPPAADADGDAADLDDAPRAGSTDPAGDPAAPDPDAAVLARAREQGVDLGLPRHVQHYLHAPDRQVAEAVANVASGRGFRAHVEPPPPDEDGSAGGEPTWTVVCETTSVLDPEVLERDQALFDQLVEAYAVVYDGWDTEV